MTPTCATCSKPVVPDPVSPTGWRHIGGAALHDCAGCGHSVASPATSSPCSRCGAHDWSAMHFAEPPTGWEPEPEPIPEPEHIDIGWSVYSATRSVKDSARGGVVVEVYGDADGERCYLTVVRRGGRMLTDRIPASDVGEAHERDYLWLGTVITDLAREVCGHVGVDRCDERRRTDLLCWAHRLSVVVEAHKVGRRAA